MTPISRTRAALLLVLALFGAACGAEGAGTQDTTRSSTTSATSTTSAPSTTGTEGGSTPSTAAEPSSPPAACVGEPGPRVTHAYQERAGVDPRWQSLDVYAPAGATGCPVVLWVHGGGWRRGDKQGNSVGTKARYLNAMGYVLVSVGYRLAQPDNDVGWPDFGVDVADAVAWVTDHDDEIGVDADHLALMGHSAGGHLVSIVSTNPGLLGAHGLPRTTVDCTVALDSAGYDMAERAAGESELIDAAFGTDPEVLADASPMVQVAANGADVPPFLVVTRGSPARIDLARRFAAAVQDAGGDARVLVARGYDHEDVNTQLGRPDEQVVTPDTTAFLRSCLG